MGFLKKVWDKSSKKVYEFINDGGWRTVIVLGMVGIAICLIGMIMTHPIGWGWILFFDIPFAVWLIWVFKNVYKNIKRIEEIEKEKNND